MSSRRQDPGDRRTQVLSPFVPSLSGREGQDRLVPLQVLVSLGWVLAAGQAAAILMLFFRSGLHPKLLSGSALLILITLSNLYISRAWRRHQHDRAWITNPEAGVILGLQMAQITVFFIFSGGVLNPFVILLFAPVCVSATLLSRHLTGVLVLYAIFLLAILTLVYIDLPWRNRTGGLDALILPLDYRAATWTALVISLAFLSLFLSWQADLARRTARALEASRLALEREQTLANVGGLAAAAAHELGTPLATIAVAAREMADVLADQDADPSLIEDAHLLVEETGRCREIIAALANPKGTQDHEPYLRLGLDEILQQAAKTHERPGIRFTLTQEGDAPHPPHQPELTHALGNIIQNAFQFATSEVSANLSWQGDKPHLLIQDDGPGYPPHLVDRIGDPYVRGGEAGRPSMGLGLFIAASLLRYAGVQPVFRNRSEAGHNGAEVSLTWLQPISTLGSK